MSEPSKRGAATQICSQKFDERFFSLPVGVQERIQSKIDQMGCRLSTFSHYRMTGADTFRLRVGDHRVIYQFDATRNELFLITLGHRRQIYKL